MDIKPCPFCGFDDPYFDESAIPGAPLLIFLVCPDCECEGPTAATELAAAELWNKRAE